MSNCQVFLHDNIIEETTKNNARAMCVVIESVLQTAQARISLLGVIRFFMQRYCSPFGLLRHRRWAGGKLAVEGKTRKRYASLKLLLQDGVLSCLIVSNF